MDFSTLLAFAKNHHILSIAWVGLLVAIIYMTVKIKLSKVKLVGANAVISLINKENAVVVDIRSADKFKKGHITDAINLLHIDIKNGSIKTIEKYKNNPLIIVDDNGMSANASAELLIKLGFIDVSVLKDGIAGWDGYNLPLVKNK